MLSRPIPDDIIPSYHGLNPSMNLLSQALPKKSTRLIPKVFLMFYTIATTEEARLLCSADLGIHVTVVMRQACVL